MNAADWIAVLQLVVLVLQAVMLPALGRAAHFLWKLDRRVYRLELQLGLAETREV